MPGRHAFTPGRRAFTPGRRAFTPGRRRALAAGRHAFGPNWFTVGAKLFAAALLLVTLVCVPRAPQAPVVPVKARARDMPAPAATHPVVHVLFVGASITSGMQQTSLGDTYPGKVVDGLQQRGLRVDWQERALWGATVFDALKWPYPADQQIIVVHLITNDFLRGTSLARYQRALNQVLAELGERSPEANLICLGTWERPGDVNRSHVPLKSFDAAASESCAEQHGNFIPLDGIFWARGSRGPVGQATPWGRSDGFHPNDVGAQRIANAVLAKIPNGE